MFGRNERPGRRPVKLMVGCLSALMTLTVASAVSAQGAGSVLKVVAQSSDGSESYYNLTCRSGQKGRITVNTETDEVCAYRNGQPKVCEVSVTIMQAAESACSG